MRRNIPLLLLLVAVAAVPARTAQRAPSRFHLHEAAIADLQQAIQRKQITTVGVVEQYLMRIQAFNGPCVNQPQGILGPITTIPRARQINALSTLNLRPTTREKWGFDGARARTLTDAADDSPAMPDALEVAAAQDRQFTQTGRLVGPLHGVVMAIKDQYDTFDMRTTSGADADYANDRPPDDATFVKRLRDAGAIILAKANLAEYAVDGARSSFGGTFCNPYDTEREPGMSSAGSASAVAANLVTCAHRRRDGGLDPLAGGGQQPGWSRADARAGEQRRHDGRRAQHARGTDLPHRRGRGEDPGRDRRLRPERRDDRVQRRPHAGEAVCQLCAARGGSTACASVSSANT